MKNILEDHRPSYQPAKVTVIEKHSGFEQMHPWAIFSIQATFDQLNRVQGRLCGLAQQIGTPVPIA